MKNLKFLFFLIALIFSNSYYSKSTTYSIMKNYIIHKNSTEHFNNFEFMQFYNFKTKRNQIFIVYKSKKLVLQNEKFTKQNSIINNLIEVKNIKNQLIIESPFLIKQIYLYNYFGRLVLSKQFSIKSNNCYLFISNRISGVYYLQIFTEKRQYIKKIIIY